MAHLDFGEATFRTRLLPGCSEYLKHDPQIKLYGMREAPVHGQGSLEGHFAVIGLPTQDLPIARCFTAIAAHPSAECGAWSAHKDFRYARWLGKEYITSIRDPADPEPDSPLCKVFQKMEEAAATIGYKPRFDAWWTMIARAHGVGGPSLHTNTGYPYRGDLIFNLRISTVWEATPIDFVYFEKGVEPSASNVKVVHRVMIPSGCAWMGYAVATGAQHDEHGGVWAHAVPPKWEGQAAKPAWYISLILDTERTGQPKKQTSEQQ